MGSVYRRKSWHCKTCRKRLYRTDDQSACKAAGHTVIPKESKFVWIQYVRAGISYNESSGCKNKEDAKGVLLDREGDIRKGLPVTPKMGKVTWADAEKDLRADYAINKKQSLNSIDGRLRLHLTPYFGGWRMAAITGSHILAYIQKRQTDLTVHRKVRTLLPDGTTQEATELQPASNAEINRELAIVKRMFRLAKRSGKLQQDPPYIPMLRENNVRTGFFEPEQLESLIAHLPVEVQPVIRFASITGWRINSEVLKLQWRQVNFETGEVRLDAGTTKNREGRVFPFGHHPDLVDLLKALKADHDALKKSGTIVPWVFTRGTERLINFRKAWSTACKAAGCPGRIPHDLRRTAVRNLVRAGVAEQTAMRLTGHLTRSVFDRYNIVSGSDLQDGVRKLAAKR